MSKQFVVIGLESQKYCIPIEKVSGVIESFSITVVPNSLYYVVGVTDIRGEIIPVISLKKIFGIEESGKFNNRLLSVMLSGQNVGFVVDSASQVVTVDDDMLSEMPKITVTDDRKYLDKAVNIDGELLIVLKPEQLFSESEKKELLSLTEE